MKDEQIHDMAQRFDELMVGYVTDYNVSFSVLTAIIMARLTQLAEITHNEDVLVGIAGATMKTIGENAAASAEGVMLH
jgi:hypothetical protein